MTMTERIIHYSEPVEFHKALPGAKSVVIMKRDERTDKPKNPKGMNRLARPDPIDEDDDVVIPSTSKGNNMTSYDYDTSRGPYHAILDKMARARQAITGESYAKAFTETYTDPKNIAIKDGAKYDDLAKAFDAVHGTAHSLVKAAPPDPPQDKVSPGPAHDALNDLIMARMKADPALSYERAFTNEYTHPANRSLKQRVDAESVIYAQRLAPAKPFSAYSAPGHRGEASNVGRSGTKPPGYAGG
jgi:hypothetical protein